MKIVITSGYFDPLHVGHIECFELAKKLGDKLIVIINNDGQSKMKKGFSLIHEKERAKIVSALKPVDEIFMSIDTDSGVCESLKKIYEMNKSAELIFAKGGDRFSSEIPEAKICEEIGIKIIDGLGNKIQSSSWIINKIKEQ